MSRIDHHLPFYPDLLGQFRSSYHLELMADHQRTSSIFNALQRTLCPDTVFCELGCGTGIFSLHAARRCAKVYAVELDTQIADVARRNIQDSAFNDKIELIVDDALKASLPEKADVIFCEMMSIWCIEELQIPVFNRAFNDLLKPGGTFLPTRIVNTAELGYYNFKHGDVELKAALPLFTGIPKPNILTERLVCKVLDFTAPVSPDLSCAVQFQALGQGTVNCAQLSSLVQLGPQTVFSGSDSLMPSTIVPLREPIAVDTGDRILFRAKARARHDIDDSVFTAEKMDS